jgi:hypothetical protein
MGCSNCGSQRGCNCNFGFGRRGCDREFRRILRELRGTGFTVSITTRGANFNNQKVVSFEDNVVFTVNHNGLVRATCIDRIDSIDF